MICAHSSPCHTAGAMEGDVPVGEEPPAATPEEAAMEAPQQLEALNVELLAIWV